MRRWVPVIVGILGVMIIPATADAAEEVTVNELVGMSPEMSGEEVTVEGELIGDYGFRDDGSMWTQLNGDIYVHRPTREGGPPAGGNIGIGIRMPADMAGALDPPGGYYRRGPVVRVTGTWKHNDPERMGESYLDVASLVVVDPGRPLSESGDWRLVVAGMALLVISGLIWVTQPGYPLGTRNRR